MLGLFELLAVKPVLCKPDILCPLLVFYSNIPELIEIALDPCHIRRINFIEFIEIFDAGQYFSVYKAEH